MPRVTHFAQSREERARIPSPDRSYSALGDRTRSTPRAANSSAFSQLVEVLNRSVRSGATPTSDRSPTAVAN
jgi:hypothetical protein